MNQRSFYDFLKRHPGVLVSVGYFVISLIGMLFSQALFRRFGVNYFNYAEVSDFLLAALREPMTFALAGGAIVVTLLIYGLTFLEQRWMTRRNPKSRLGKLYKQISLWAYNSVSVVLFVFVLYSYLFLSLYGDWKSEQIKLGIGKQLTVELATDTDNSGQALRFDGVMLLGTSNKFIFVYGVETGRVDIIPNENIARLIVAEAPEQSPDAAETDAPVPKPKQSATRDQVDL